MTLSEVSFLRLANQKISHPSTKNVVELISWMGAMQAQDYNMAKWALGLRLKDATEKSIQDAFNKGKILRTHLLRPTWHMVASEDISWMLQLTAPQIKIAANPWNKKLELTETIFKKCTKIIESSLEGGIQLTREELYSKFENSKIIMNNSRLIHIMLMAELNAVVCSGALKGKKHTYSLFSDRVPIMKTYSRDQALGELALRYFNSHGPATLQDFAWWSGLPLSVSKKAIEIIRTNFHSETIDNKIYWFSNSSLNIKSIKNSVYLLPAFDEFIISYKDRRASLAKENQNVTISKNGIFNPVIVINGQVAGLWKKNLNKNSILMDIHFFNTSTKASRKLIENCSLSYGKFLNQKVEIQFN
jgi:hypothetical protein